MATPQSAPHPPLHPSSASKKNAAATAVHTPAGPASNPRSVPSPAAIRGSGKAAGKMNGGTPMGLSLSSLGMSPSGFTPGMMMGGGVGGPGFTPGSAAGGGGGGGGGVMMMPSMSELGLSSKRGGGDGEFERKRRMRGVLRKIGGIGGAGGGGSGGVRKRKRGGNEEGICRISRRVGLANDVDAEGEEARREREGERGISIAGRDVLIDVEMRGNRPRGVVVAGMGGVEMAEMERAGKVLEGLLVGREDQGDEGDLEGFGRELGRIAALDRVGERGVSAFQAISGVGGCLERLWRKECEKEDERVVLRKKSGRPWMHARGRIGLGVDYWTTAPTKDHDAMDLDHHHHREEEDSSDFLTLHLTAETCPAGMYPPVRVSSNWLAEDLSSLTSNNNKTDDNNNEDNDTTTTTTQNFQQIPWQDPPPTYTTPPTSDEEPAGNEQQQQQSKLPDIRFLAKLDPPLIVPYQIATQLLAELGGEGVQGMVMFREWGLMLAGEVAKEEGIAAERDGGVGGAANRDAEIRAAGLQGSSVVVAAKNGEEGEGEGEHEEVKHIYSVDVSKAEWGYRLTEFPFAHPRGVLGVLPVLRQWGVFGGIVKTLLKGGGGGKGDSSSASFDVKVKGNQTTAGGEGGDAAKSGDGDDVLERLLLPTPPASEHGGDERREGKTVRISVEISTSPAPTLSFGIPLPPRQLQGGEGEGVGRVVIAVERNGDLRCCLVEGFGKFGGDDRGGDEEVKRRIGKALEVCGEEVGVWIQWVRGRGWEGKGRTERK